MFTDLLCGRFQSWFDFDVNGEDNREKIIAQEREQHVLSTLHQVGSMAIIVLIIGISPSDPDSIPAASSEDRC